jgi:hypothetical protein
MQDNPCFVLGTVQECTALGCAASGWEMFGTWVQREGGDRQTQTLPVTGSFNWSFFLVQKKIFHPPSKKMIINLIIKESWNSLSKMGSKQIWK